MKNKLFLSIIGSQSVVMLILIYFLWGQNANEDYIGANTLFFLALFSVVSFLLCLVIQFNKLKKDEESNRCDGTVKWYNPNKGFGFIEQDIGEDLFVHQTEIRQSGFRYLNLGDRVEYEVGKGKKGPVALKVIRTKTAEPGNIPHYPEEPEEYPVTQDSEMN